eukprot:396860-Pyramimonas_sp.AAC.1
MGKQQQQKGYQLCPHASCGYRWNWKKHSQCWQCGKAIGPAANDWPKPASGAWAYGPPRAHTPGGSPFTMAGNMAAAGAPPGVWQTGGATLPATS